jgi:hypothetical protein
MVPFGGQDVEQGRLKDQDDPRNQKQQHFGSSIS